MRPRSLVPWTLLPCFPLFLAEGAGCGAFSWGEEVEVAEEVRELETARLDGLALASRSGRVEAASWAHDRVRIRIVRKAFGRSKSDARSLLGRIRIDARREGGLQRLRAEIPSAHPAEDAEGSFFVSLPARMGLQIDTHNGAVEVQGVDGPVSVRSHNGRIELWLPRGFSASLRALASNGAVHVEGPGRWEVREAHEARGIPGSGGPGLWVESHSGEISLRERP